MGGRALHAERDSAELDVRNIFQIIISEIGRIIDQRRAACGDIVVNRWLGVAAELWTLLRYAIYADLCRVVKALCKGL